MKFIDKILDVPKLILRIWLVLWFILFILLGFKFCFNLWYPIVVENEVFIAICNFIDDTTILKYLIMFAFYITSANILSLASIRKLKYSNKLWAIATNITIIICFALKYINNSLGMIFEIIFIFGVLPITFNVKNKTFNKNILNIIFPIIIYFIVNIWQLNIGLIRDIFKYLDDIHTLIAYILQIDYYIFIIITWLGAYYMGLFSVGWLWGKSEYELRAIRNEELKKPKPNKRLIEKIDRRIDKILKKECK